MHLTWEQMICEYYTAPDLLNRHHGLVMVLHPRSHIESWQTEARLEGQLGLWASWGTGSATPRPCRGTALHSPTVRASTASPLGHPGLPLWLRVAINTAQRGAAPWQLQKPGESNLQQPCWCRKYEIVILGKKPEKQKLSGKRNCQQEVEMEGVCW